MRLFNRLIACVFSGLAASMAASPALFAQEATDEPVIEVTGRVLKTEMSGFAVAFPAPGWVDDENGSVLDQSRSKVTEIRPGLTSLVFHKKDENTAFWSELMAVLAVHVPGYTAGQQFKRMADPLAASCMPGQIDLSWIVPLPGSDREALVGMCGAYNLQARQTQACIGGIVVAVSLEAEEGVVTVYNEWCTPSYDVKNPDKWPVSRAEIENRARMMQSLTRFEVLPE